MYNYDRRSKTSGLIYIDPSRMDVALKETQDAIPLAKSVLKKAQEMSSKIKSLDSKVSTAVKKQVGLISTFKKLLQAVNEAGKPHPYLDTSLKKLDTIQAKARSEDWMTAASGSGALAEVNNVIFEVMIAGKMGRWRSSKKNLDAYKELERFISKDWAGIGKVIRTETDKVDNEVKALQRDIHDLANATKTLGHDDAPYELRTLAEDVNFDVQNLTYPSLSVIVPTPQMTSEADGAITSAKELVKDLEALAKAIEKHLFGLNKRSTNH